MVVLVIFAFQAFAQIDILTGGGPAGSTETLVWKIFNSQQPLDQGDGRGHGHRPVRDHARRDALAQFLDPRPAGALWQLTLNQADVEEGRPGTSC